MLAVCAADICHGGGAVAERGFVDGEALLLPVVGGYDAISNGLFKKMDRILVVDLRAGIAAVVKEAAGVCLVGHAREALESKDITSRGR